MKFGCVIKSLKSDFKNVIIAIIAFFGIIAAGYCVINGLPIVVDILKSSISSAMSNIGVYEWFIIFESIGIILSFILNMLVTQKSDLVEFGSAGNYAIGIVTVLSIYGCYYMDSVMSYMFRNAPTYPDVNLICVIFVIISIVLTPFALAYVRCKEE